MNNSEEKAPLESSTLIHTRHALAGMLRTEMAACGATMPMLTRNSQEVTCPKCRAKIEKKRIERETNAWGALGTTLREMGEEG